MGLIMTKEIGRNVTSIFAQINVRQLNASQLLVFIFQVGRYSLDWRVQTSDTSSVE